MVFERVELRGASIITKADIGKGRSAVTVSLDAPLTSEAAAALGCQDKLFTSNGEVRPDLFFSTSLFHLAAEAVAVHLELDGIAKREVEAPDAEAGPVTIELTEGSIRLKVRLVVRGSLHTQLRVLGFALEAGNAPLICRISARAAQHSLGGDLDHVEVQASVGSEPHRFVVEELLDHAVVSSPNNHAPAPATSPRVVPSNFSEEAEGKVKKLSGDMRRNNGTLRD